MFFDSLKCQKKIVNYSGRSYRMENFFQDDSKIKIFAKFQKFLSKLTPKSSDEDINLVFEIFPSNFLEEKQNLIMVCQMVAKLCRSYHLLGRIGIKLYEKLLKYMQLYLQNESALIWNTLGACSYFKFWMYKRGLINIEQIIYAAQKDQSSYVAQYFLPEIIEQDRDMFDKVIRPLFPCFESNYSFSDESIQKLKKLREKHLKWLEESGDFFDESYLEIETDPLRLSIKRDDISSFQLCLSRSNISINSTISESVVENFFLNNKSITIIGYSAIFCAKNIFKFLIMNGVETKEDLIGCVFQSNDYEFVHLIENEMRPLFEKMALFYSIGYWNIDTIKYIIENYRYEYLINDDEDDEIEDQKKMQRN